VIKFLYATVVAGLLVLIPLGILHAGSSGLSSQFPVAAVDFIRRKDTITKCADVERGLAWKIVRLSREPKVDRSWREFIGTMRGLAERINALAEAVSGDYYARRPEKSPPFRKNQCNDQFLSRKWTIPMNLFACVSLHNRMD